MVLVFLLQKFPQFLPHQLRPYASTNLIGPSPEFPIEGNGPLGLGVKHRGHLKGSVVNQKRIRRAENFITDVLSLASHLGIVDPCDG